MTPDAGALLKLIDDTLIFAERNAEAAKGDVKLTWSAHYRRLQEIRQAASPGNGRGEEAVADQIIGQIEERFPDWKGFRDLIDCIDVTLHRLRGDGAPRALSRVPTAGEAETPPNDPDFKWGMDYGKDILKDINQLAHAKGTGALHRDVLQRAYREISRLSRPVDAGALHAAPSCRRRGGNCQCQQAGECIHEPRADRGAGNYQTDCG
jgi:hypothetical protein